MTAGHSTSSRRWTFKKKKNNHNSHSSNTIMPPSVANSLFYWNRPLGAAAGTFRLTAVSTTRQYANPTRPACWALPIRCVTELVDCIRNCPIVIFVELEGDGAAWEALDAAEFQSIQDAIRSALRYNNSSNGNKESGQTSDCHGLSIQGLTPLQTSSMLASTLSQPACSKYSIRLRNATTLLWPHALPHLHANRRELKELHLDFGASLNGAAGELVGVEQARQLAEILHHVRSVSLHHVPFTPVAWSIVAVALEESITVEHSELSWHVTKTDNGSANRLPRANWQAYLDWNARLNTVRRCLLERPYCQPVPRTLESHWQPPYAHSSGMNRRDADACDRMAQVDAVVVVLKDWWLDTHRPAAAATTTDCKRPAQYSSLLEQPLSPTPVVATRRAADGGDCRVN